MIQALTAGAACEDQGQIVTLNAQELSKHSGFTYKVLSEAEGCIVLSYSFPLELDGRTFESAMLSLYESDKPFLRVRPKTERNYQDGTVHVSYCDIDRLHLEIWTGYGPGCPGLTYQFSNEE